MNLSEYLRNLLLGDSQVAAACGARVWHQGSVAGGAFPHISFFQVTGNKQKLSGLYNKTFQVDVWALNYSDARPLADAVTRVLDGHKGSDQDLEIIEINLRSDQELMLNEIHHVALTFSVDERRN